MTHRHSRKPILVRTSAHSLNCWGGELSSSFLPAPEQLVQQVSYNVVLTLAEFLRWRKAMKQHVFKSRLLSDSLYDARTSPFVIRLSLNCLVFQMSLRLGRAVLTCLGPWAHQADWPHGRGLWLWGVGAVVLCISDSDNTQLHTRVNYAFLRDEK